MRNNKIIKSNKSRIEITPRPNGGKRVIFVHRESPQNVTDEINLTINYSYSLTNIGCEQTPDDHPA